MVRVTGLEPVTSTMSTLRSSQLSYTRPEKNYFSTALTKLPSRRQAAQILIRLTPVGV